MTRRQAHPIRVLAAAAAALVLIHCGGGAKTPPAPVEPHDQAAGAVVGAHDHPRLEIPADRQRAWGLEIGEVRRVDLTGRIAVPGIMALNENRTAHVSSFVRGQVASLSADLGAKVREGQPLLVVNSPEFAAAQADFLEARARYNLGLTEYRRAEALWQAKAIEEKEFLRRRAESEKLAAEYGALGSKLHSLGLTHEEIDALIEKCRLVETQEYKCEVADPRLPLLSPLAGTVIYRDAVVGAHVEPGAVLFTVSDLSALWANLDVPEADIPSVGAGSRVSVRSALFPGREFPARIGVVSDVVDQRLRTLRVRVEVDNGAGLLKPNMYVEGLIEHAAAAWTGVLAVPEDAVQTLEDERVVFVREKEDVFAVRHVRLGDRVGGSRIILDGLEEGEAVVLKGAFTLKSELTKGAAGHGHIH